jgi:hypothetical protein
VDIAGHMLDLDPVVTRAAAAAAAFLGVLITRRREAKLPVDWRWREWFAFAEWTGLVFLLILGACTAARHFREH